MSNYLFLGATSEIAIQLAFAICDREAAFHLIGRDSQRLSDLARELSARGARAVTSRIADLNDDCLHRELISEAESRLGSIDVAVLAQGILIRNDLAMESNGQLKLMFLTNLIAPISLVNQLIPVMRKRGRGMIVGFSSVAGDRGRRSNFVYGASKAGLNAFLSGLRSELHPYGIEVLTAKFGPVRTRMAEGFAPDWMLADPARSARKLAYRIRGGGGTVYIPGMWRWIMVAIQTIPEWLLKKLRF